MPDEALPLIIVSILFPSAGIIFIAIALKLLSRSIHISNTFNRSIGVIVDHTKSKFEGSPFKAKPVIEFGSEEKYRFVGKITSPIKWIPIGKQVKVFFNPRNPRDAYHANLFTFHFNEIVLLLIGAGWMSIGIYVAWGTLKRYVL